VCLLEIAYQGHYASIYFLVAALHMHIVKISLNIYHIIHIISYLFQGVIRIRRLSYQRRPYRTSYNVGASSSLVLSESLNCNLPLPSSGEVLSLWFVDDSSSLTILLLCFGVMSETSFPASVVVLILVTSDRNKCRNSSSEFSLLNDVESSSLLDDVSSLSLEDDNDDDNEDKFSSVFIFSLSLDTGLPGTRKTSCFLCLWGMSAVMVQLFLGTLRMLIFYLWQINHFSSQNLITKKVNYFLWCF